jgi:hypothetical protein
MLKPDMKKISLSLALISFLPLLAHPAAFTGGDLLVVRVGDGTTTLGNTQGPISILELNSSGGLVQPALGIGSGSGGLQVSGSATSEGQLVRNADGNSWTLAGYVPPFTGSGSLSSRTSAQAPRGYLTISSSGTASSVTTLSGTYSGQNIRSGFASGSSLWFAGSGTAAGSGIVNFDGSTATTIQGVNSRVLNYNSGNLFYSTGSGTQGIYKYSGTPTSPVTSTAFLTGVAGQGTSPYDFVFSPDGNSLYVADDGIGVQKFVFNGSAWALAYNFTDSASANKAYGLAIDFSGANPVLYWTSPTDLWSATDAGAGAAGTSILSAGANYAFRGLDMVAVPEPSALSFLGLGLLALVGRRFVSGRV